MAVIKKDVNTELNENRPPEMVGRTAILEAYKAFNPDLEEEPGDEDLWGFANSRYADLDNQYSSLSSANTRLAKLVSDDPKLGAVLSMIAGEKPKSLPYAIASIYGKEPFELDGEFLEEFEQGYQDNLRQLAADKKMREEANRNIEEYKTNLIQYGQDNGLNENELMSLNEKVYEVADNMLMGIIPIALIDVIYKGLNYDRDLQEAADTGFVEGKNQAVEAKLQQKRQAASIPDLRSGTRTGRVAQTPKRKGGSFFDELVEE